MPVPSKLNLQQRQVPPVDGEEKGKVLASSSGGSSPSPPPVSPPVASEEINSQQQNKLFIGALSGDTTEETLDSYFSEFGDIVERTIMKDQTGRSRGFGFITFKDPNSIQSIIDTHAGSPIVIDNKIIDPKPAVPKKNSKQQSTAQVRRIFVGGLSSDTDEDDMREFFETFGPIEEVQLMFDKHTSRHRGFGFITFEKPGPAAKVCSIQFHDLKKKRVEVKVAQTKEALAHQADKARAAAYNQHNYCSSGSPAAFNYSPTYPSFFPHYPMAYYGGYGYPSDHHLPSPPFYPPGYNGGPLPGPFFMRGATGLPEHSPPLPLNSPDYLSEHFQGLAIIGNPFVSPTGSPPHGFPVPPSTYSNGGGVAEGSYSPPTGLSSKDSITGSPVNGYSQVSNYQAAAQSGSYSSQQQASA